MRWKSPVGLHSYLLALSPVLFLYSRNADILKFRDFAYSSLTAFLFVIAAGFLLRLCVRDRERRTLMLSCVIVFLFLYSNFVSFLMSHLPPETSRHSMYFVLGWGFLLAGGLYVLWRFGQSAANLNKIVNVFAVCLVSFSVIKIAVSLPSFMRSRSIPAATDLPPTTAMAPDVLPNIYLLIFDEHMGPAGLETLGYDSSPLIDALERRGFYVARQSRSNYWYTTTCIPSLLNFDYLQQVTAKHKRKYVTELRDNNRVFAFLKQYGYTTVQCRTDFLYRFDEVKNADMQLISDPWYLGILPMELISNTPFIELLSVLYARDAAAEFRDVRVSLLRQNILDAIEKTKKMAHFKPPFILYTHLMSPHGPYCFNENGDYPGTASRFDDFAVPAGFKGSPQSLRHYLAETTFIDTQLIAMVDYILEHSATPPIILVQGDHGLRTGAAIDIADPQLFSILNAMYLPGVDTDTVLYPSISPVNTFRIVFNQYFNAGFELLEDRSCLLP